LDGHTTSAPRWIGEHSQQVLPARGDPARLTAVFRESAVPMVMLDDQRRYVAANRAARSALARTIDELRQLRLEDMTPPHLWPLLESNWQRMLETGWVRSDEVAPPGGNYLGLSYYGIADVLPARHLLAFAPAGWPVADRGPDAGGSGFALGSPLTRRERQVLELAADGLNGPSIAKELVLSTATVRTHFAHIYRKLGVPDRAAAVAKAMRLGLFR
jgi:DNA-binding CsgD family transcriptional regulator